MTKEITKSIILQEIQDKFKLREFADAKFLFDETVVPVYEIHDHVRHWRSIREDATAIGTGVLRLTTVPANEKWLLRAYSVVFQSGAFTIAGVYILRKDHDAATNFSYLDLTAAQNVSYLRTLPEAVSLEPGDQLNVNVDGFTTTGTLMLYLDYMREEIR